MVISNNSKSAIKIEIEKLTQLKRRLQTKKQEMKAKVDQTTARLVDVNSAITKLEADLNG